MDVKDLESLVLSPFRKDLELFPGPDEPDGSPSFVLFDPIKGQYYKIGLAQATVMRVFKPGMTLKTLLKEVNERSSFKITNEELTAIFQQASLLNLLSVPKTSESVGEAADRAKTNIFIWLVMHYLYIRIPLTNPDSFLTRTLHYVEPLLSKPALFLYGILSLTGLIIVGMNFERYIHTFTYFFTIEGFLGYVGALAFVKLLHELGHAYTAKHFKIHVPTMGLAFLVLFPVLYTNVTNAWRLKKRIERFAITVAGVAVELALAGLSTLGWALTDPGIMNSIFFLVSSTTWITSLFLNLNPAMRFDGYYLMTDILSIDNLQQRAFGMTRWRLRELFFDLKIPPPEEGVSQKRLNLMTIYSVYTWTYRIILYTAIALFVYYEFTKALGILLFLIEVVVFIMAPFFSEFKQLYLRRSYFNLNPRAVITFTVLALAFLIFVVPLPHVKTFPAITDPVIHQDLYIQEPGDLEKLFFKKGDEVKKGDLILLLRSDPVALSIQQQNQAVLLLQKEIEILEQHEEGSSYLNEKKAELKHKESELETLNKRENHLQIKAEIDGKLYELSDLLHIGLSIGKGVVVGKIGDLSKTKAIAFVPENESYGIKEGETAYFKLQNPIERIPGKILKIYKTPTPYLRYPALASIHRGPIAVLHDKDKLRFLDSYYQIDVLLERPLRFGQTGVLEIEGPYESKLWNLIRRADNLIRKESGF